jgi:hypothetical protein
MHMIRHEAVRKIAKVMFGRGTQEFFFEGSHERGVGEVVPSLEGAERQ